MEVTLTNVNLHVYTVFHVQTVIDDVILDEYTNKTTTTTVMVERSTFNMKHKQQHATKSNVLLETIRYHKNIAAL